MPVHKGTDSKGTYYQFGDSGKKYYTSEYPDAKAKAETQQQAAYANGYKGD
jgi:hypothetical protein